MSAIGRYVKLNIAPTMCSTQMLLVAKLYFIGLQGRWKLIFLT